MTAALTHFAIKDGDIFRWCYKDEKPEHRGAWGRYHCKSQIAVAKDGVLSDTYWHSSHQGACWSYDEAERDLELTFVANFANLEKQPEYMAMYYEAADCVNLNHANSPRDNFYIRKGAKRSKSKMLDTLADQIAKAEQEIEFARSRLDRYQQTLADIYGGKDLNKVYL